MDGQDSFLTSSISSSLLSSYSLSHPSDPSNPSQTHPSHAHSNPPSYLFGSQTALSSFAPSLPSLPLTSSAPAPAPILPSSSLHTSLPPSLSLSLSRAVSDQHDHGFATTSSSHHYPPYNTTGRRVASTQLQSSRNKRTKLSTEERAKVLEIRRQRACLRCKMLKIQCSRDNPCKPCLSSAVRGYERKVLSFCYCVRTRFADVDIFHSNNSSSTTGSTAAGSSSATATPGIRRTTNSIPDAIRHLMAQVEPPALPAMDELTFEDTLLRWLTSSSDEHLPTGGSVVAMLYTVVGQSDSLRRAVDSHLPADFQTFLFATSLVHTGWSGSTSHRVSHRDLCIAGHVCGSRLVQRLDRILTPQFLAKCDRETHRALLLLIFGLILGVSYSTRLTTSPSFPHDMLGLEMRHSPTLWLALKEHLAQMLAHHLIFLGSTLGIKLDTASEKRIIETAVNRWNKPERSLWAALGNDPLADASRAGASERSSEIALISGVFGLRGIDDLSSLQHLSGPATSQTPRTVTTSAPGADSPPPMPPPPLPSASATSAPPTTSASTSASPTTSLPLVAVTYPDLADLQSMPEMTSLDADEHHYYTRDDRAHDALLDNNPESFYTMTNDDLADLLSPAAEREDDARPVADDGQHGDQTHAPSQASSDGSDATPTPTPTARTGTSAPPPPSRSAMGHDGMTNNTRKRRSVWIVRPHTDSATQEPVNVYARFRVNQGQNLGLFV